MLARFPAAPHQLAGLESVRRASGHEEQLSRFHLSWNCSPRRAPTCAGTGAALPAPARPRAPKRATCHTCSLRPHHSWHDADPSLGVRNPPPPPALRPPDSGSDSTQLGEGRQAPPSRPSKPRGCGRGFLGRQTLLLAIRAESLQEPVRRGIYSRVAPPGGPPATLFPRPPPRLPRARQRLQLLHSPVSSWPGRLSDCENPAGGGRPRSAPSFPDRVPPSRLWSAHHGGQRQPGGVRRLGALLSQAWKAARGKEGGPRRCGGPPAPTRTAAQPPLPLRLIRQVEETGSAHGSDGEETPPSLPRRCPPRQLRPPPALRGGSRAPPSMDGGEGIFATSGKSGRQATRLCLSPGGQGKVTHRAHTSYRCLDRAGTGRPAPIGPAHGPARPEGNRGGSQS